MCANPIDRNLLEIIEATSFPPAGLPFFFGIGFRKKTDLSNVPFDYLGMKKEKFDDLIWKVNDTYEEHIKSLTF